MDMDNTAPKSPTVPILVSVLVIAIAIGGAAYYMVSQKQSAVPEANPVTISLADSMHVVAPGEIKPCIEPGQTIAVCSPKQYDYLRQNGTMDIQWKTQDWGARGNVSIDLVSWADQSQKISVAKDIPNSGSYTWAIAAPTGEYAVSIYATKADPKNPAAAMGTGPFNIDVPLRK